MTAPWNSDRWPIFIGSCILVGAPIGVLLGLAIVWLR